MNFQSESDSDLNPRILSFGREVFKEIGQEQPSTFNKNFWAGRIMEWSMKKPDFKVNMFRLVDVLPSLKRSSSIAQHASEYLGEAIRQVPGLLGGGVLEWGLNAKPHSMRAKLTSYMVMKGVKEMASLFIAGEGPRDALKSLECLRRDKLCFTVDLLGEFSVSEQEANVYLERYMEALTELGKAAPHWRSREPLVAGHPGDQSPVCISVKLTALYSQCNILNFENSVAALSQKLSQIVRKAKEVNASLYVDAEDSGNNPIIYATFMKVFGSSEFKDFSYPGIVVQAYSKTSEQTLQELLQFAKDRGAPIAVRLVKGAYWDHETILSAQNDWPSPLFAIKESTDAHFEHLSRFLVDNHKWILPAFGSHNVRSLSHACCYAESKGLTSKDFELQMLYGMAAPIARAFSKRGYLVRLYVPLGNMIVGMGYLVRRLLENTSNESFLRHTFYDADNTDQLLVEPQPGV